MAIAKFLIFLLAAHFLLMQVFRLSTYHRYFFRSLPLLVGYAALAGFVFQQIDIAPMYFWYLAASAILLWFGWRANGRQIAAVESEVMDNDHRAVLVLSAASTRAYFLTSAVLYLFVFSASFLYFYNSEPRVS